MIEAESVHHIGIAVRSIDAHRHFYETVLGARFEGTEDIAGQQVRVAFFAFGPAGHEVRIELLEPTSEDSTIARFVKRQGEGLHHVAYAVSDLAGRLRQLDSAEFALIDHQPRPGAHGAQIAFLHPKSTGHVLTELVQPRRDEPPENLDTSIP